MRVTKILKLKVMTISEIEYEQMEKVRKIVRRIDSAKTTFMRMKNILTNMSMGMPSRSRIFKCFYVVHFTLDVERGQLV